MNRYYTEKKTSRLVVGVTCFTVGMRFKRQQPACQSHVLCETKTRLWNYTWQWLNNWSQNIRRKTVSSITRQIPVYFLRYKIGDSNPWGRPAKRDRRGARRGKASIPPPNTFPHITDSPLPHSLRNNQRLLKTPHSRRKILALHVKHEKSHWTEH